MSDVTCGDGLEIRSTVLRGGSHFVRTHDPAPCAADDERGSEPSGRATPEPTASVLVELGDDRGGYTRVHLDERGVEGLTIARLRQAAQVLLHTADELEHALLH